MHDPFEIGLGSAMIAGGVVLATGALTGRMSRLKEAGVLVGNMDETPVGRRNTAIAGILGIGFGTIVLLAGIGVVG